MIGRQVIRMADLRVAGPPGELAAIGLGSCVAVVLYDPRAPVGGLAHVVLPTRPPPGGNGQVARYAGHAVPALVEQMLQAGGSRDRLTARLIGGARMFPGLGGGPLHLGARNVLAVREALVQAGIPITGEWVGGEFGRSAFFDLTTGLVRITSVGHGSRVL